MISPRFLVQTFTRAVVRRVAFVLVALVLAWLGVDSAKAQDISRCTSTDAGTVNCPSVSAAIAGLNASMNLQCAAGDYLVCPLQIIVAANCTPSDRGTTSHDCRLSYSLRARDGGTVNRTILRRVLKVPCPAGQVLNPVYAVTGRCQAPCDGRASETFSPISGAMIPNGSVGCTGGCATMISSNGDGSYQRSFIGGGSAGFCDVLPNDCSMNGPGYTMNYGLGVCQPPLEECSANQIKDPLTGMCTNGCPAGMHTDSTGVCVADKEDCPAGNVRSPAGVCLPGDGQCAAGEARRKDGTCGRDSNGDGEADDDDDDDTNDSEKETFSGGDNCTNPPSCAGGPIACGQARIQWRIECNTRRKVNITGGACSAMPVCVGDNCNAMEYAQLLQQWRTTCALEKNKPSGEGGSDVVDYMSSRDAANKAQADAIAAGGDGHEGVTQDTIFGTFDNDSFNPNLFGGGSPGMCSFSTSLELMGKSIDLGPGWWSLASAIGWLVVASAYVTLAMKLAS